MKFYIVNLTQLKEHQDQDLQLFTQHGLHEPDVDALVYANPFPQLSLKLFLGSIYDGVCHLTKNIPRLLHPYTLGT